MALLIASFPEVRDIGKKVARRLGAEYTDIVFREFPDSEFHLALGKNPKNKTVVIVNSISKDSDEKLIETILAGGIARDYKAKEVILMATYFPYMRQDRHFMKYDSFSSKYIVKMFSNFDKIITIDPHLHRIKHINQISKKAISLSTVPLIAKYIKDKFKDDFTIIGPDEESFQWSRPVAKLLGKDVIVLKKTRYSDTKVKVRLDGQKSEFRKHVILIDDIISTGKTIADTINLAHKNGAKHIVCIGIHGLLVNNADKLIRKNAELVTTNTIPNKFAKIDVSPLIVDALKKYI